MVDQSTRALARQGWIQLALIVATIISTSLLAFSELNRKADTALEKATRAETKADKVEVDSASAREELIRIRTILDERLPKKTP